jgi:hypothetical protein
MRSDASFLLLTVIDPRERGASLEDGELGQSSPRFCLVRLALVKPVANGVLPRLPDFTSHGHPYRDSLWGGLKGLKRSTICAKSEEEQFTTQSEKLFRSGTALELSERTRKGRYPSNTSAEKRRTEKPTRRVSARKGPSR